MIISELLKKDRLEYINMIRESEEGLKSLEIAEEILKRRKIKEEGKLPGENVLVNKRLRGLTRLGILVSRKGRYNLTALGHLVIDSWDSMSEKIDIADKFGDFFEDHVFESVPKEFSSLIFKLRNTKVTENASQWDRILREEMKKTRRKLYNLTTYLHDFPDEILQKKIRGEIDIAITYQFRKYPQLNYSDEKNLFDRLIAAGVELRHITLKNRHPIGIRIVDEKWATFLLPKVNQKELDRDHAFIGNDPEFISWCRDLMYHIWHFEAEPLNSDEVTEKRESDHHL